MSTKTWTLEKLNTYLTDSFHERLHASNWMMSLMSDDIFPGKRFLDIGSGTGPMLVAAALKGASYCVGIEPFPFNVEMATEDPRIVSVTRQVFREALKQHDLDPARFVVIDAFAEDVDFLQGQFDVCTFLDVLEHVQNIPSVLKRVFSFMRPSSLCLVSTSPLYYSASGHHFFAEFPISEYPWVHLYKDFDTFYKRKEPELQQWRKDVFCTLSKVTHGALKSTFAATGWDIIKERSRKGQEDILPQYEDKIDLSRVPTRDDLLIDLSQFVVQKPAT